MRDTTPEHVVVRVADITYDLGWRSDYGLGDERCVFQGPYLCKGQITYIALAGTQVQGVLLCRQPFLGDARDISTEGTLVRPAWRRKGVARALWTKMLMTEKPCRVYCTVVTDRGRTLVESVKQSFPEVEWKISEGGMRQTRTIKGKGRAMTRL